MTFAGTQNEAKKKQEILHRQNCNVVDTSHLHVLLPVQLNNNKLKTLHDAVGNQPTTSSML